MAHGLCVVSDFASCFSPSFLALAQTYIFLSSELSLFAISQVPSSKLFLVWTKSWVSNSKHVPVWILDLVRSVSRSSFRTRYVLRVLRLDSSRFSFLSDFTLLSSESNLFYRTIWTVTVSPLSFETKLFDKSKTCTGPRALWNKPILQFPQPGLDLLCINEF